MSADCFEPEWLGIKLGQIRRFQGHPLALTDREHSILCVQISLMLEPGEMLPARWCLTHDLAEAFLGDWHGPSKTEAQRSQERIVNLELEKRGWFMNAENSFVKHVDHLAFEEERRRIWPEVYGTPRYLPSSTSWEHMVQKMGAYVPAR